MYSCKICNKEFKSRMSIMNHIMRTHHYTGQQYYDEFFKKENDGFCENCGKPTKFLNIDDGYANCCCIKCAMPGRAKRNLEKHGYISNFHNPEINKLSHSKEAEAKRKKTMNKKYNVDYYTSTKDCREKSITYIKEHKDEIIEKTKKTNKEKYDVEFGFLQKEAIEKNKIASHTKEANEKRKNTTKKHYGVDCIFKLEELKEKSQINSHTKEALAKRTKSRESHINEISYKSEQTKRKKGRYSKLEQLFEKLCNDNNIECIDNYYLDERYPYLCDFYLPKYDYFVEIFGGWFHSDHIYGTKENDEIVLNEWKEKLKTNKNYSHAINTWSIKDVEKVNCAKAQNLNFIILWNDNDITNFFINKQYIRKEF